MDTKALAEILGELNTDNSSLRRQKFDLEQTPISQLIEIAEAAGKTIATNFRIDDDNRFCYTNLIKWLVCDPTMECGHPKTLQRIQGNCFKGIYLYGPTGTGKTVAIKVLMKLTDVFALRYKLGKETDYLRWKNIRADELVDAYCHGDTLNDYKNVPLLCIQDLGSEEINAMYMGNHNNVAKTLIEQRGDRNDVVTLITSNIPLESPDLVQRYGERAVSRLRGMCNYLTLRGKDRRTEF